MRKNTNRLTEKRMSNRKFRRNEEKILRAFCQRNNCTSAEDISKRAGVARATFYRHHKTVGAVVFDYKRYILRKYGRMIRGLDKKSVSMRTMWLRTMYFMMSQRWVFEMLMKSEGRGMLIDMVVKMKPKIRRYARLTKNHERMLNVYIGEVVELMYDWSNNGMKEEEAERLARDIVYLADTMKTRLKKLALGACKC